jgi:hypothetical protein
LWLDVCVPTGALEPVFKVCYPLDREENLWLDELDAALLVVADRVYGATAFDLAFVGEEVSGYTDARELLACDANGRRDRLGRTSYLVSPQLNEQLQFDAALRPSGLLWRR